MSKHTAGAVKKGWILIPCDGEAHDNPRIDNCGACAPRWGEIEVHEASFRIGQRRALRVPGSESEAELLNAVIAVANSLEFVLSALPKKVIPGVCAVIDELRKAIAKAEGRNA